MADTVAAEFDALSPYLLCLAYTLGSVVGSNA
jgi:hypothetical protein